MLLAGWNSAERSDMPLALMSTGSRARVMSVSGNDTVKKHLGSLGLIPGAVITVVQMMAGNMVVGVRDSRIAINGDLTRRVQVEPA